MKILKSLSAATVLTEGHFQITISLTMWALTDRTGLDVSTGLQTEDFRKV